MCNPTPPDKQDKHLFLTAFSETILSRDGIGKVQCRILSGGADAAAPAYMHASMSMRKGTQGVISIVRPLGVARVEVKGEEEEDEEESSSRNSWCYGASWEADASVGGSTLGDTSSQVALLASSVPFVPSAPLGLATQRRGRAGRRCSWDEATASDRQALVPQPAH